MIVTTSIFEGELTVGQITEDHIAARLQWFINKYEPLYLRMLLGGELYDLLTTELSNQTHDVKWDDLAEKVKPMTANYIYFFYKIENESQSTGVGLVKQKAKNATRESVIDKAVARWNEMVNMVMDFNSWIRERKNDYPEYKAKLSAIYHYKNTFGL